MNLDRGKPSVARAYSFGNIAFRSDTVFPELLASGRSSPDFSFRLIRDLSSSSGFSEIGRTFFPDGRLWLTRSKAGLRHRLDFDGLATFLVEPDSREIQACPQSGTSLATVRHLFLNQVVPLYLSGLGSLVIHAGAVARCGHAIAFLGDAGQGKSTLAGALLGRGCELVTDDTLLLDLTAGAPAAVPSYPGLRLWPDSLHALGPADLIPLRNCGNTVKKRFGVRGGPLAAKVPIARIYLLSEPADRISIQQVPPAQVFPRLIRSNFLLDPTDRAAWRRQFEQLSALARLSVFFSLSYPRDFSVLPRVCDEILRHAAAQIPL